MPLTVGGAFDQFRRDVVDLDPENTKKARASRDNLFTQIKILAKNNSDFPELKSDTPFINFGSFARRTKIKPLDDIDFLVILNGSKRVAEKVSLFRTHKLQFIRPSIALMGTRPSMALEQFLDDNDYINSTILLNRIKCHLSSVKNYEKAEIRRRGEVVTLKLNSYSWNYDIVPAIPMLNNYGGTAYFLIPDGKGNWKPTDPRIDEDNTTRVNKYHDGKFLPVVRLLKYWNSIAYNRPRLSSYYFETLAIKVFELSPKFASLPHGVKLFFDRCPYYLNQPCPDLKCLEPDLDADLDWSQKEKVREAMASASVYAGYALTYELNSKHKDAIKHWQSIFGSKFPNYD
ncbi:hypothetical protein QT979_17425 [Microcoleus sp. w2-18bC1]|uniref:hypothetical protein n=1 Tax=unclassified Microcoleus TaxID=2642155 RepID=UPI002FD633C6